MGAFKALQLHIHSLLPAQQVHSGGLDDVRGASRGNIFVDPSMYAEMFAWVSLG